ncbi:MAG: 4Fe-4S binding protein [Oscillospiraceae bacterium]|nr:4Fe-4S binding protein [Oscillospiraceae bacterium]
MAVKINEGRCKGCGYCIRACGQKALSFSDKLNAQGVNYVQADESKCVGCGLCYIVCPDQVFEVN